jgi:hypothetical protein
MKRLRDFLASLLTFGWLWQRDGVGGVDYDKEKDK